jgi:hypothetical protein
VKARIDAGGREVEVETSSDTNVDPHALLDKVLATWEATEGAAKVSEGPAFGLQASSTTGADRPYAADLTLHPLHVT